MDSYLLHDGGNRSSRSLLECPLRVVKYEGSDENDQRIKVSKIDIEAVTRNTPRSGVQCIICHAW